MDSWNEFEPLHNNPAPEEAPAPAETPAADNAPATEEAPKPEAKTEKPARRRGAVLALALVCAVLGGAVGSGGTILGLWALGGDADTGATVLLEGSRRGVTVLSAQVDTGELLTAAEVYALNVNSTVGITTAVTTNYFGFQTTSAASGSGFILTEDGYILTNYHVVEDSSAITITLYDGSSYDAELVGCDESSDIAVLKVEAEGLTPVVLGSSDDLQVGEGVIAIGNPLGELTFSLTEGVVSALNRDITLSSGVQRNLIQTDCAINSGNSGGALFNLYGEVIGITNAKYSSSGQGEASIDNIGFAIAIDEVRSMVEDIIENGYVTKPWIGVSVTAVSRDSQALGLPSGAAVNSVTEDSPAAEAGLQKNDIITQANGQEIPDSSALVELVSDLQPGDELVLTVYRQGQTLEITVIVAESRQEALPSDTQASSSYGWSSGEMFGGGSSGGYYPFY